MGGEEGEGRQREGEETEAIFEQTHTAQEAEAIAYAFEVQGLGFEDFAETGILRVLEEFRECNKVMTPRLKFTFVRSTLLLLTFEVIHLLPAQGLLMYYS